MYWLYASYKSLVENLCISFECQLNYLYNKDTMTGRIVGSCMIFIHAMLEPSLGNKPHLPSSVGPFPAFLEGGTRLCYQ